MTTRGTIEFLLQTRRWDDPEPTPVPGRLYLYMMVVVVWIGLVGTSYAATDLIQKAITAEITLSASQQITLPGLAPLSQDENQRLFEAYKAKGPDYIPRTRHRYPDGTPNFINPLIFEASPYLLQHAHNPVHWYAWGNDAFEAARTAGKLILLSIGYSTCYWCHVMETESFEDEEVATTLNSRFIAIKVDREERPDLDKIYMDSVVAIGGRGGWPLTVFLTPDLHPVWGATYFPKDQFLSILGQISNIWITEPDAITESSMQLRKHLESQSNLTKGSTPLDETILQFAYDQFSASFDHQFGGFGKAPKFPPSMGLQILLRIHHRTGDSQPLKLVEKTLDRMAQGGMYDHLGGGFHRYSTDDQWLVPHFEKMLYDNALLAWTYLEAYQVTGKEMYSDIVHGILNYVLREMTDEQGGFYSAQDAGEIGEEGIFYLWSKEELKQHLTTEEWALFEKVYGITESGNVEGGRNVLALQEEYNWKIKEHSLIESAHDKLMMARSQRSALLKDDKILTAWNGLMIATMAKAYQVLGEKTYLHAAQQATQFLKQHLTSNGKLLRRFREGEAAFNGYLDDYSYLIAGLLALYEADFDSAWIDWARELQTKQDEIFWDAQLGAYYYSRADDPNLIQRSVDLIDRTLPNSNAVSALNLLKLHDLTFKPGYQEKAKTLLAADSGRLARYPSAYAQTLIALDYHLDYAKEIAVIGPTHNELTQQILSWLRRSFIPNKTLGHALPEQNSTLALVANKPMIGGEPTVYVCENNVCKLPTSNLELVKQLISDVNSYSLSP